MTAKTPMAASRAEIVHQRDNWKRRALTLERVIRETLHENAHLADGDDCTLRKLKDAMEDPK